MKPSIILYHAGSLTEDTIAALEGSGYLPVEWSGLAQPQLKDEIALRDYFAAKAMQSLVLALFTDEATARAIREVNPDDKIATMSYSFADAMLEARKNSNVHNSP